MHFDLSAMLPCLDRCVMVVRSTPAAVLDVPAGGGLYVWSALQESSTAKGGAATPSRTSHRCVLRGAGVLHERFGVTDPEVFRLLSQTALGVEDVKAPPAVLKLRSAQDVP